MASIGATIRELHKYPRASDNPESPDYRKVAAYAWPGGYPIVYVTEDGEVACPNCVNRENEAEFHIGAQDRGGFYLSRGDGWRIVGAQIHYEGRPETCCHCNTEIESAHGDPENDDA